LPNLNESLPRDTDRSACVLHIKVADSHDRVSQEVNPDPVPPDTVLGDYGILVGDPVQVPPVNSGGVMNTEDIHGFDLKVGGFKLRISSGAEC